MYGEDMYNHHNRQAAWWGPIIFSGNEKKGWESGEWGRASLALSSEPNLEDRLASFTVLLGYRLTLLPRTQPSGKTPKGVILCDEQLTARYNSILAEICFVPQTHTALAQCVQWYY